MTDQMVADSPTIPPRRWRAIWRRSILLIVIIAILFVARGPILRAMAMPLIFADHTEGATSLLMVNGEEMFSAADQFQKENPGAKILLLKHPPDRLVRLNILPSLTDRVRDELARRGVDIDRVIVIAPANDDISPSVALTDWLKDRPAERLIVLCDAYSSRALRWDLNRKLPADCSARLFIRPLAIRSFDSSRWWSSKRGCMAFVRGWLGLVLPILESRNQMKTEPCDPEVYQRLNL